VSRRPRGRAEAIEKGGTIICVTARLRRLDGTEIEHACSFTPDEWQRLDRFISYARDLTKTTLLSTDWALKFSISADEDGARFEGTSLPDPDHFRALLLLMRPFVLQHEETSFERVVNILARRLDHPAFRVYLDRQKAIFDGQRCQLFKSVSNGTVINSPAMLTLWLNAYEYHRDEEKRLAFEALHHGMQPMIEHSEAVFVAMMLDQARAVIEIGTAIFALRQNAAISPLPGDISLGY
jgi:hypothetical protein